MSKIRPIQEEPLVLIVCGSKWDLEKTAPKDLIHTMILAAFDQKSRLEVLVENGIQLIELLADIKLEAAALTDRAKKDWRRNCTLAMTRLSWIIKVGSSERMLAFVYDHLLSLEDMGTLSNFSAVGGIEKGTMNYNPERKSIMKRY